MKENIIKGTIILTITTIIIRAIGFVFRIYLANTIGAEGIGLHQLIMAFYMLTVTLATSGISVAVSRLVSEEIAKNKYQNAKKALRLSIIISLITSTAATVILFFGAETVSIYILKDIRAALPLKYLAPSLPFLAFSACYRGYFYAVRNVVKPTTAQVLEQIVRIFVTIYLIKSVGTDNIIHMCSAVTIGMTIGEIISYIYILFLYLIDKKAKVKVKVQKTDKMLFNMLYISIPVAGSSYLNSALRLLENALIPIKLAASGMAMSSAMSIYGMIKGMVMPILFFPTSFLSSLATMLLPSLSGANANNNEKHITYTLSKVLHFTSISGILVVCLFMLFPYEIGNALYKSTEVGSLIKILSFLCPFMYINMIISSVLNALGEQVGSFKINFIESAIKIVIIFFLVPIYGFNAYLFALFVTTILNTILYVYVLLKISYIIFDISNWIFKPIFAAVISGIVSKFLYTSVYTSLFSLNKSLLISVATIGIVYLVLLFAMKSLKPSDIETLKKSFKRR